MTDFNAIARGYIELWNERTPERRRDLLARHWTHDATYVDPLMSGEGRDGVDSPGKSACGVGSSMPTRAHP
jgi:hypothetical protein